ncbi:hypothetical protein [Oligosphaera ethanolica]|uniref:Uncharacterized protein n=1 Tax=Oligosphaera ethanolica TaxID=760260 RepID=A0AAE4AN83_9BACT|nr:hypothetical protein [Oligosphaera ethanolica]MDQ0289331.1 hypothetical protein [Oligosphaera ethanolica]
MTTSVSNHPGGENTGDNLQETHGQSPHIWEAKGLFDNYVYIYTQAR